MIYRLFIVFGAQDVNAIRKRRIISFLKKGLRRESRLGLTHWIIYFPYRILWGNICDASENVLAHGMIFGGGDLNEI